jgi:hypothetical protein
VTKKIRSLRHFHGIRGKGTNLEGSNDQLSKGNQLFEIITTVIRPLIRRIRNNEKFGEPIFWSHGHNRTMDGFISDNAVHLRTHIAKIDCTKRIYF